MTFILAVARFPAIAAALAERGYSQEEHDLVWDRLAKLGALPKAPQTAGQSDKEVGAAIQELDAWDEPNFAVIRAVLQRFFPALVDQVFKDLEAKQGVEAVYSVSTMLDRLDQLEKSGAEGKAALKRLEPRGYTKAERQRLRGLITVATKFAPKTSLSDADRVDLLMELYAWITDWSATAKAAVKRRQHLISLGIAAPRQKALKAPGETKKAKKGNTAAPADAAPADAAPANAKSGEAAADGKP